MFGWYGVLLYQLIGRAVPAWWAGRPNFSPRHTAAAVQLRDHLHPLAPPALQHCGLTAGPRKIFDLPPAESRPRPLQSCRLNAGIHADAEIGEMFSSPIILMLRGTDQGCVELRVVVCWLGVEH